ncbi:hypothetical protein CERSUDRAFT_112888 [Gelatoporia subvermispora B]|uniref:Oxidase ustYa n=1 Tax=Ceriporiopsis subvermispora (strain B) TaxID=914234 RepID=M2R3U7_CERS8|nr:hypothetical protein CERSUDRAFT_112888 [Gelatoporia subvermispora B]
MPVTWRFLSFALFLASCLNLAWIWTQTRTQQSSAGLAQVFSYDGHDFPETLPLPDGGLPTVSITVEESVHYPLLGMDADDEWFSLTSAGWGYVRLGPADRLFAVTMFHELHCLRMLNRAFGNVSRPDPEHIEHCLNYLRQGILCSADLALEPGDFETKDYEVERMGATHKCGHWDTVYSFVDEKYASWEAKTH